MPASRSHFFILASFAIVVLAFFSQAYWFIPNHDDVSYIIEAKMLLAGGRFYSDIMETNPPLIVLLTAPGIWIGQATGLGSWVGFTAWVCLLTVASLWAALPYLRWLFAHQPAAGPLWAFIYLAIILLLPGYDFGQREHLTIILFLPALLWFAAREAQRPSPPDLNCLIALILAAVGLLIKPFFLLVAVILVLARAATHRDWRILFGLESIVFLLAAVLYAATVFIAFPGWLASTALATQVYFALEEGVLKTIADFRGAEIALVFTLFVLYLTPFDGPRKSFLRQLAIAAVTFLVIAIIQRKGWSYHTLPVRVLTALIATVLAFELPSLFRRNRMDFRLAQANPLILLAVAGLLLWPVIKYEHKGSRLRDQYLATAYPRTVSRLAAGGPWVAFSTSLWPAMNAVGLVNDQWSSRSPAQWLIPGIVKLRKGGSDDRARAERLQKLATGFVVEDLERYKPAMVAIQASGLRYVDAPFDFLSFYSEDEDFRRVWTAYQPAEAIGDWQFFVRRP